VRPDATSEEIQEAYHDLYDKFGPHVSVQGMDPDILIKTFHDISDAYEVLMDPPKRREYDRISTNTRQSSSDLRALWTKHSSTDEKTKIPAMGFEVEIEVSLKEAVKGIHKQLKISDPRPCKECVGLKPVNRMQCPTCHGLGYFNVERKEEIDLPAGMYDGMELRMENLGRFDLRAQRNGELIAKIKLKQHPYLAVLGRDITCTVPVTIYEAILGAEIEVPTAVGRVRMKVQPLSQPGRVFRLKGLGLAGADQLVTIEVLVPQQLTNDELAIFQKLRTISKEPNPRESIFAKISSATLPG
jgi:DnaJ-class molecular chaperone